jgi:hypothetical protein
MIKHEDPGIETGIFYAGALLQDRFIQGFFAENNYLPREAIQSG